MCSVPKHILQKLTKNKCGLLCFCYFSIHVGINKSTKETPIILVHTHVRFITLFVGTSL